MASIVRGEGEGTLNSWYMGQESGVVMFLYGTIGETLALPITFSVGEGKKVEEQPDLAETFSIAEGKVGAETLDFDESFSITNS